MALTRTQSQTLKLAIDERAVELEERIRDTLPRPADETTLERTGVAQDEVDEATISAQEHFNHTLHQYYRDAMRQAEIARERADNGLLNRCADCDEDIGYERLRAYPFAVRCLDCQARHERRVGLLGK